MTMLHWDHRWSFVQLGKEGSRLCKVPTKLIAGGRLVVPPDPDLMVHEKRYVVAVVTPEQYLGDRKGAVHWVLGWVATPRPVLDLFWEYKSWWMSMETVYITVAMQIAENVQKSRSCKKLLKDVQVRHPHFHGKYNIDVKSLILVLYYGFQQKINQI